MQDQIEQEWACAAAHAASLAGGTAAAVRAPSATALRSCLGALEQVRAHLQAIDTMQRSLQGGGAGGGSKKRGAEEPASAAGAAKKKPKAEDPKTASEGGEIIPDLDDPDVPSAVWDWHLKDGNITHEQRQQQLRESEDNAEPRIASSNARLLEHDRHQQLIDVFKRCMEAEHIDGARMSQLAQRPVAEGSRELAELAAPYVATSAAPLLQTDLEAMAAMMLGEWREQAGVVGPAEQIE